jgi:co-chaperonin GroES (HSP10)
MATIFAYGDRVLIKPDKSFEKELDSGIVMVNSTKHGYLISGEVVDLGDIAITIGTVIYYNASDALSLEVDGQTLHVLDVSDIQAYKTQD